MVLTLALWHRTSRSPWQDSVARYLVPHSLQFCCLELHPCTHGCPANGFREGELPGFMAEAVANNKYSSPRSLMSGFD